MGCKKIRCVFFYELNNKGADQTTARAFIIHMQQNRLYITCTMYMCMHPRACTRGIWKVLSMVFYPSSRFTNPIVFGITLKNYLSSMLLWHKFHEDIMMQTRQILL